MKKIAQKQCKTIILFVCCLVVTYTVWAQNGPTSNLYTNKTTGSGLGNNVVNSVLAYGSTIEAATNGGLSISTNGGTAFTNYTTLFGLGSNKVNGAYLASSGTTNTVYAGTANGLSISTGLLFSNKTTTNGLGSNVINQVLAGGTYVLVATSNGVSLSSNSGASFVNSTTGLGSPFVNGVYSFQSAIFAATNGGLGFSQDGGVTYSNFTKSSYGLASDTVYGIFVGTDSVIYAATKAGLSISRNAAAFVTYNKSNGSGLGSDTVYGVYSIAKTVYAATKGGLSISTDGGYTFTNYTMANGLGSNLIHGVYATYDTIYAATDAGLSYSLCTTPVPYTVTGGGSYCAGGSGVAIGLSGSNIGVSYQLFKNGVSVGTPVAGTAAAISFGTQTAAGTYTVIATKLVAGCNTTTMTGSATIAINVATASSNSLTICNSQLPYTWNGVTFLTAGTKTAHLTNAAGCDSAATLTLSISTSNTWTGAVSTDWHVPNNWCSGTVPTSTTDAIIAIAANQPVLNILDSVKNITIDTGATFNNNSNLYVFGNWTNAGTLTQGVGTVILKGASGTLTGGNSFYNLTVAGNYGVGTASADTVAVLGILNKVSGTFTTNNKLTLKSTSAKTALIEESGGSLSGNINMERYVGGSTGYHHLSSPVSNATVGNWGNYFPITGTNGVNASIKGQGGSLQEYREATNTTILLDSSYYNYTSASAALIPAKGFVARLNSLPVTVVTSGTPSNGTVNISATASAPNATTRGWNLLGNPYPSPISWAALKTLNPGKFGDPSCYIWKSTGGLNGVWQTYNGTAGTNGVGNVIASSQGFFVFVNSSNTITFNNTVRTQDLSPTDFGTTQQMGVRLSIVNPSNSEESDEILAYTKSSADDASSIKPSQPTGATNPTMAFIIDGKELGIHAANVINDKTELPLSIKTPIAGVYILKLGNYNAGMPIYLKDKITGSYTDLQAVGASIQTQQTETKNRYSIVFSKAETALTSQYNAISNHDAILVSNNTPVTNTQVIVYDILGKVVAQAIMNGTTLNIPVSSKEIAGYIVRIVDTNKQQVVKKVMVLE